MKTPAAAALLVVLLAGCPKFHSGKLRNSPADATFIEVDGVHLRYLDVGKGPVVVLLHAKASTDEASWARRQTGARALRRHLDAAWPTVPVWVLGDFNDDVDRSIADGRPSPTNDSPNVRRNRSSSHASPTERVRP